MEISKNVLAVNGCACKIKVIAVKIDKTKTIFILVKVELSTKLLKLWQF